MFILTFLIGHYIMKRIFVDEGRDPKNLDPLLYHLIIGTIVGARLGHCLFYDPLFYLSNPLKIFAVWEGGLASHGGAVGIILSLIIYCRKYKESFLWILSRLSLPISLGAALIRMGNLFNSEIIGRETVMPWGVIFLKRIDVAQVPRHPAQVYESIAYIGVFCLLIFFYKKAKLLKPDYFLLGCFLVTVFTARFFIEFLKINQESYNTDGPLNTGQLLSIPFVLAGITLLIIGLRNQKKEKIECA